MAVVSEWGPTVWHTKLIQRRTLAEVVMHVGVCYYIAVSLPCGSEVGVINGLS